MTVNQDAAFFDRLEGKLEDMRCRARNAVREGNRAWMHEFDQHFWRWQNEREDRDPEVRAMRRRRERFTWNPVEQTA